MRLPEYVGAAPSAPPPRKMSDLSVGESQATLYRNSFGGQVVSAFRGLMALILLAANVAAYGLMLIIAVMAITNHQMNVILLGCLVLTLLAQVGFGWGTIACSPSVFFSKCLTTLLVICGLLMGI